MKNWYKVSEYEQPDVPPECTGGDCYAAAGRYMMRHGMEKDDSEIFLVHGMVTGQGQIAGIRYDHAWIEKGDTVIDVSNNKHNEWPKEVYYAIGNIRPEENHYYNIEQFREKILEHEHWGPWT